MELSLLLLRSILAMEVMVLMGWAAAKKGIIKSGDAASFSALTLYVVYPCTMLSAFQVEYTPDKLRGLALALVASLVMYGLAIPLVHWIGKPLKLDGVEKGSLVYSNSGNLIIPLVTALLGTEYVIYTSPFLIVQTVLSWTHCVRLVDPAAKLQPKKVLLNPGVLACFVGMFMFLFSIRLPGVVASAVNSVGLCVGPLAMFTIGMLMAQSDWGKVFNSRRNWWIVVGRLIILPGLFAVLLACSGITRILPEARQVLLVTMLAACAPVAATISQLAAMFSNDGAKAGQINVLSVICSIPTMPLLILFYQAIC